MCGWKKNCILYEKDCVFLFWLLTCCGQIKLDASPAGWQLGPWTTGTFGPRWDKTRLQAKVVPMHCLMRHYRNKLHFVQVVFICPPPHLCKKWTNQLMRGFFEIIIRLAIILFSFLVLKRVQFQRKTLHNQKEDWFYDAWWFVQWWRMIKNTWSDKDKQKEGWSCRRPALRSQTWRIICNEIYFSISWRLFLDPIQMLAWW